MIPLPFADLIDAVFELTGVWFVCGAVGSAFGVTAAVLLRESVETAGSWGATGTAMGSVSGALAICALAISGG